MSRSEGLVLALSGGIGGAKLALGLYRILPPEALIVVANTGDDFEHLGLAISPDTDTLLYTLAGLDNSELGFTHLVFHAPGPDQARFLKLYAEQVVPLLRAKLER